MQIKKETNYLESLRGIAALLVVVGHLSYYKRYLDITQDFSLFKGINFDGHLAVLLFFCLSGYVIGASNTLTFRKSGEVALYLKKRFIRIYPLFLVTLIILVPITIINGHFNNRIFLDYLFFTFGITYPYTLIEANPLWSLQYEVLFYLMFIPLAYFKLRSIFLPILLIIVGIINLYLFKSYRTNIPAFSVLFGFAFWLWGLYFSKQETNTQTNLPNKILSSILSLFMSYYFTNFFIKLIPETTYQFFFNSRPLIWLYNAITFQDLMLVPICVYFLVNFANIKHPLNTRIANLFFILIPSFHFIPIIVKSPQFLLNAGPAFYLYLVCIAFMFNHKLISTISEQFIKLTQYTGSISYGLYIFHFPILCYFSHVKIYPGTTLGLSIKFVLYMTALFIFSHIAERIIQPRIKSYFLGKF